MVTDQPAPDIGVAEVQRDEELLFVIISPDSWENGEVPEKAFPTQRLKDKDLSVCRVRLSSEKEVYERIVDPQIKRREERALVGGLSSTTESVVNITHESESPFCVLPKPIKCHDGYYFKSHAAIGLNDTFKGKNKITAARSNLAREFKNGGVKQISQIFGE